MSYKSVLGAGAKAKTVTSLFFLLSVLCLGGNFNVEMKNSFIY